MLNEVADGVWVRQSAWVWSNAIAVRGEGGLILVDPGIDGSDLNQLADDLDRLGLPVVAGFSTHPHWDHLLWHPRFGDAPRYATPAGAHTANEARERAQTMAAESASGVPLELIGLVTPLPADGGPMPGTWPPRPTRPRSPAWRGWTGTPWAGSVSGWSPTAWTPRVWTGW
jgi:glyoxylase-like metal-dependent hydrolase (beta-lactamase superfamily II)